MQRLSTQTSHQIRALFKASSAFFDLPATATFGDLAERVRLGRAVARRRQTPGHLMREVLS